MKNENEFIKIRLKIKFFRAYFRIIIKNQLIQISEYREQDHRQCWRHRHSNERIAFFERFTRVPLWELPSHVLDRVKMKFWLKSVMRSPPPHTHLHQCNWHHFHFPSILFANTCCGLYAHRTSIHTEWNGGNINSFRQVCWQYGGPIAWQDTIGIISIFCFGMQLTCLRFPIFSLCHSVNGFIAENAIIAFYLHSSTCIHHAMWQILNHDRGTHFIGLS